MAPAGVSIHASRVPPYRTPAGFAEPPGIDTAAELLAELAPRAIVVAYTGSSYALGAEADGPTRTRLEERVRKIPVVLTAPAATEALRVLGAKRVALIHPPWYSDETNARGGEYYRGQGFDVVLCARLTPARPPIEVDPAEVFEWVQTNTPPQADAVFIGGNGFRTVGAIHALETALGRPVLTANQAAFWAALRAAKVKAEVVDYGRIFAHA
jgi:maleate isomerase